MMRWLILILASACLISACVRSGPSLQVAGSTSIQPLAEVLAERFRETAGIRVSIQGGGSTAGTQAVLHGMADLGMISRELTPEESAHGLDAHRIGYDLLAVIVHPMNPVNGLSLDQLRQTFSGGVTDWRAIGGRPGPIHLITREAGSGSREAFRALVGPVSPAAIVQNSSGAIRAAVLDNPQAIGYVSLGVARMGGVKVVAVGNRLPEARSYPLVRSLSFVTRGEARGDAQSFIRFARSTEGRRLVKEEGLVPVGDR